MSESKLSNHQRKTNTIIFYVVTGLLNVVLMVAMLFAMFLITALVIYKVFQCKTSIPIQIASPIILVGGFILDFFVSIKLFRLLIIKFNLKDKINEKVADQYLYNKKHPKPAAE